MKLPRQARRTATHRTPVRNPRGLPILCAWDTCDRIGYDEHKFIVREGQRGTKGFKELHYIFCTDAHKRLHMASHHSYGKLHP